ncbi:hypothetical protein USB125703_01396 [Pseudoclavibacter triregionum]|nr:hypothetical protein USB125703_01396 [Pseudoclavibacter triregionum]
MSATNDDEQAGGRLEQYLDFLDELVGEAESGEDSVESTTPGVPDVLAIDYEDTPEDGLLLGFTYGLSLVSHEAWTKSRPELSICLETDDPAWARAIAELVERERGMAEFAPGEVFDWDGPIVEGTEMDGFVIAGPLVLDEEFSFVEVGEDLPIRILGVYPVHASERDYIDEHGVDAFWKLDWDPYDPARKPAV